MAEARSPTGWLSRSILIGEHGLSGRGQGSGQQADQEFDAVFALASGGLQQRGQDAVAERADSIWGQLLTLDIRGRRRNGTRLSFDNFSSPPIYHCTHEYTARRGSYALGRSPVHACPRPGPPSASQACDSWSIPLAPTPVSRPPAGHKGLTPPLPSWCLRALVVHSLASIPHPQSV